MVTDLRKIGIDRRYWFPAVRLKDLRRKPLTVQLWYQDIVVFRTRTGEIVALEDRCRHRKVALSSGQVSDTGIVCPFHGWCYGADGRLAGIPYWPKNRALPKVGVRAFPTRVAGGIVWVYAGNDQARAESGLFSRLDYPADKWIHIVMDRVFLNHFAFGVVNGMDFFHFHLHRRYQPWQEIKLVQLSQDADSVTADYEITVGQSLSARLFKKILQRGGAETVVDRIHAEYVYPHHFARVAEDMKVGVFFRPIDRERTQVFIDMHFARPARFWWLRLLYLRTIQKLFLAQIQAEDAWAGELEQRANERAPDVARIEVNPTSLAAERVMEARWRAFKQIRTIDPPPYGTTREATEVEPLRVPSQCGNND